jgi:hypothetical protein
MNLLASTKRRLWQDSRPRYSALIPGTGVERPKKVARIVRVSRRSRTRRSPRITSPPTLPRTLLIILLTKHHRPRPRNPQKKPYANLLGSNGKLTNSEKEHRHREGLCGFCGNKHKLEDCKKRKKANKARGKASTTQSSTSSGADANQSKK